MGFFNKNKINPNKVYTIAEALQILNNSQYEEYTTKEVIDYKTGNIKGYNIIPQELATQCTASIKERKKIKNEFEVRMSNNGEHKGITINPNNYNNYQSAKSYQKDYIR